MHSRDHAIHSGVLAFLLWAVAPPPGDPLVLVLFVLAVGIGIDGDHFLIARINTGTWKNLGRVVRNPRLVIFDQSAVFDTLDVWAEDRLFSHALIGGGGVGLLWLLDLRYWAVVAALTLYVHILADIYAGVRGRRERIETIAAALDG